MPTLTLAFPTLTLACPTLTLACLTYIFLHPRPGVVTLLPDQFTILNPIFTKFGTKQPAFYKSQKMAQIVTIYRFVDFITILAFI